MRCEHDTLPGDAARLRLAPEIAHGGRIGPPLPQDAARDLFKQPHPNGEHLGRDLVKIAEGAEDEAGPEAPRAIHDREHQDQAQDDDEPGYDDPRDYQNDAGASARHDYRRHR